MQAVILAAGKSKRTYPLTITKPKPLLKAANKTLIEHNLEALNGIVNEAVIVLGYKKDMIKQHMGKKFNGIKITYAEQKMQCGTANALLSAKRFIKGDFISMHGDDIYSRQDFENVSKKKHCILIKKVKNPQQFGAVIEKNGMLADIVEKPQQFVSDIVNTGLYKIDDGIFAILQKLKKSTRGEYELTDAIKIFSKEKQLRCISASRWIPIGFPWDLLYADIELRSGAKIIGEKTEILGIVKNCSIGENCTINGTVKNSIVMDNSYISEGSIIEDSIIGENVSFDGRIFAGDDSYSSVCGKTISTGRFGAVVGDGVKALNVRIKPGCKIWPYKKIKNLAIESDLI